jgi:hypothetical protein
VAELGAMGEKYRYPPGVWEAGHSLMWLRNYEAGQSPAEAMEEFRQRVRDMRKQCPSNRRARPIGRGFVSKRYPPGRLW